MGHRYVLGRVLNCAFDGPKFSLTGVVRPRVEPLPLLRAYIMPARKISLAFVFMAITISTVNTARASWVDEGLALARMIEAENLYARDSDWSALRARALAADGTEKLRLLEILALRAVKAGDTESVRRMLELYRQEIEAQRSERYRMSATLIEAFALKSLRNDTPGAISRVNEILGTLPLDGHQQVLAYRFLAHAYGDNLQTEEALVSIRRGDHVIATQEVGPDDRFRMADARGYVLDSAGDYPGMVRALQEAVEHAKGLDTPFNGAIFVHNLAFVFSRVGETRAARETSEILRRITDKSGVEIQMFFARMLCGSVALGAKDYAEARDCLLQAQDLLHVVADRKLTLELSLAETFLHLGEVGRAETYLDSVVADPDFEKDRPARLRAERLTLDVLHARGRYQEAFVGLASHYDGLLKARDAEQERIATELRSLASAREAQLEERAELLRSQTALQATVIARQQLIAILGTLIILGAVFFIVRQQRTSQILREARNQALAASAVKSEFLANMSHEIRTPMYGVLGMAELLQDTSLNERQRTFVDTIYKSGSALLTIINDVLDFSKIEAGKMQLDPVPFELESAVEDVAALLARKAQDKGVELLTRVQADLPQLVEVDGGRLRQVLTNLVGNAVKFTHQGYVVIEVTGEVGGGGVALRLAIRDTGIGIPSAKVPTVFDQFTQAEGSTTRKYGGTGLGLSITKSLVEAMGGEIGVESELGYGSVFWVAVDLPIVHEAVVPERLEARRVLVVDDLSVSREILFEQISGWGLEVMLASGGMQALQCLRRAAEEGRPFELVVSDFQMPEMDGAAFVRSLRADPNISHASVIVTSSASQRATTDAFLELTPVVLLSKPVRSATLRAEVERALGVEASKPSKNALASVVGRSEPASDAPASDVETFRALVAEDNMVNRRILENMIDRARIRTDFVEDGLKAYEAAQRDHYDVILMDISMPEMDGVEATKAIRAYEASSRTAKTPIIALTAHAMEGDRQRFLAAGMNDYLTKPVRKADLRSTMEKWLPDAMGF